jgi:hypothetical protein
MGRRWPKVGAATAGGVAVGAVTVAAIAAARWNNATERTMDRLISTAAELDGIAETYSPDQLVGLPAPVLRYFTFALTPGQRLTRNARIRWEGEFRSAPNADWKGFTAVQHFTVRPSGFVWDATIRMVPLTPVRVRDSYVAGEGAMLGKLAALIPVVDQRGTPEMAAGALSRYLGEAAWLPTALLPSAGVTWTPVDDATARATLTDGATTVSADFHFAPTGEIVGMSMTRYRDVNGRGVPTPFEATLRGSYRRAGRMMIPVEGEVAWLLPDGRFAYWRGRPTAVDYDQPR